MASVRLQSSPRAVVSVQRPAQTKGDGSASCPFPVVDSHRLIPDRRTADRQMRLTAHGNRPGRCGSCRLSTRPTRRPTVLAPHPAACRRCRRAEDDTPQSEQWSLQGDNLCSTSFRRVRSRRRFPCRPVTRLTVAAVPGQRSESATRGRCATGSEYHSAGPSASAAVDRWWIHPFDAVDGDSGDGCSARRRNRTLRFIKSVELERTNNQTIITRPLATRRDTQC